jgi:hypothetical protein
MLSLTEKSRVETLQHRSPEVAKCETPKSRNRHIAQSFMDTRVSDTGRWRCQRLSTSGVPKCRNAKSQKPEIGASLEVLDTGFRLPGDGDVRDSHHQVRSPEVPKCEIHSKQKLHHHDVSNSEMSKGTIVSLEKSKGKMSKSHQPSISVGYVNRPITSEIL